TGGVRQGAPGRRRCLGGQRGVLRHPGEGPGVLQGPGRELAGPDRRQGQRGPRLRRGQGAGELPDHAERLRGRQDHRRRDPAGPRRRHCPDRAAGPAGAAVAGERAVSAVVTRSRTHKAGWAAMLGVLVLALFLGVTTNRPPTTEAGRFQNLTKSIACPVCEGQSVLASDSDAAKGIRARIAQRLDEGATDAQIRNELADAYGQHILLTPARSGLSSVVWTLP